MKKITNYLIGLLLISTSLLAIPLAQVRPTLWPKANYVPSLMVAGAPQKALIAYGRAEDGSILDIGALREVNGQTEVLIPSGWVPYIEREHKGAANAFSRVGPGWSFGNNSIHNSGRGWFAVICGRKPDIFEAFDMQYSGVLFETLKRGADKGIGTPQGITEKERETICTGRVSGPIVITPPPVDKPIDKPIEPICPPVLPCPTCPSCPSQSAVICPILFRLVKEFSCTN